ncbi:MAG TPA: 4Fe-4S binding protein [Spirochaetota bacterium]|nr:4Fe-4S binding protein [Spirochaetota bacterium]HOD15054.1 4Fe-4S binding protein [Spirochaetota bacterium]HPG49413.1 4Fe-4S binding protein [Spirochaetota bacterium]HQL82121.1 4Fe-4S binding protein [Spirochaetota bacterium]
MNLRPSWWLDFLRVVWPLTYLSAKMTQWPVVGRLFSVMVRPIFTGRNFNISHIPVNRDIRGAGSTFLPERLLEELIRRSSHRIIINRCTCRESEECRHYPIHEACLQLGEGTRAIPPHIATRRTVDEALAHMRKMVGMGLIPMIGRVRMDDFFYGTPNTGRSLTICFCCTCCCTIFKSARYFPGEVKESLVRLRGLSVTTDMAACTGCGTCVSECFTGARTLSGNRIIHDDALCKGCGRCATVCPSKAVAISIENIDGAINEIMSRIEQRMKID